MAALAILLTLAATTSASAQTIDVGTSSGYVNAIQTINSNPANTYTLNFIGGFTMNQQVANIASTSSVTLTGNLNTINGAGLYQPLIINSGTVTLENLSITNTGAPIKINGGTLVDTSGNIQGLVTNNADVVFAESTSVTYTGNMSGTGQVEINSGQVTFSGLNSYSGGTTVDSGSMLVGTTSSLQGTFTNNGSVQFNQNTSGTYAGAMSGTGAVEISGTGPVTFSGLNGYSGGTTVDSGSTLIGTTNSLQGAFVNNGMLHFNQSTSGSYAGAISGFGGVEISGIGPVTFSGSNTYGGGTTVDNGSELIGTTDSLQGTLTNNGAVQFNQTTSGTYSGNMSGLGSVEISGIGSVTFSGSNSYSGGTSVDSGSTLIGTTDSLQGTFSDSGTVRFNQSTSGTYSGVISGTGGVEISGVGPVTFTGLNNYSGGTTVDLASTLIGATDSLQGAFTNNGTVQFNQSTSGTYAGAMTGTGSVEISGTGPITFSGLNSYSGGTTVDNGSTLIGTTDSLQRAFTNNGAVQFTQTTAGAYAGNMSGAGSVEISGVGPITFSGANSYTGGTTIDLGSSLIGTTNSLQGAITNYGAIQFDQSTVGTYAGNLSGTGSVEISGLGTVNFSGTNSYTGGTTVDGGSMLIGTTNSLQGDLVNNGAVEFLQNTNGTFAGNISGTGSVEDVTVGVITFTGVNSYTGGTTVDGGSTMVGTTSSLQGDFTNNGAVQFLQNTSGIYGGNMSGAGSVEISGTGPITFSGTNSYVGGTTVDSGSTLIGTTNSLQGVITNNGALQFNQTTSGTYAGNLSGTGGVEISGIGPITFSGSNTYTGGTTVDVGSSLSGTTSSLQGSIVDNGAIQFSQAVAGTYAGNLSGTGTVEISGLGAITLSGSNSYSGGTLIDVSSILTGTTSSIQGTIFNEGNLKFNQTTSGTYAGNMSGVGGVEISGTGPITFTGTDSYLGGTQVDAGATLIGTTSNLQGDFADNGTVRFNQSTSGTFASGISGTGFVEIGGGGTVTFSGLNNYSGGTSVDHGSTLIGTTASIQGAITNNGAIQFNQGSSGIYSGNMKGTGSVEVSGGGPFTFSGTNTYSGGTTVDGGTTLIGTTSSLQGDFTNNGAVHFNQIPNGTYSGNMEGAGSLEIGGGGAVTMTGLSFYTGGTTVDSGSTLIGSTYSVQGNITNNGFVEFNRNNAGQAYPIMPDHVTLPIEGPWIQSQYQYIYSGNMSGTGRVEITGGGFQQFTGTNTYTGGTTVDANNTLFGSTNSLQGTFINNGAVEFIQSPGGTYSGNMSGTGSVEINSSGTLTFSGVNSYTGGTTVMSGNTLIGTTDSLQGAFNSNGIVIFDQATAGTYSGNMIGQGSVEITGSAPVTFSGTNAYTGGTTVDNGSSLIGTTSSLQGLITNNGLLQFSQTTSGTFASVISGTGGVEIGGVGPVTFSGVNTYTGGTTIGNGSTLIVGSTGSIGDVSVNGGGTLMGEGNVGNTTVNAGGTIYPGTVGAPLTINGNFVQGAGSTYSPELNPTGSDKIVVTGTAQINNGTTLSLVVDPGTYTVGTKYQILSAAGGLTGAYSSVVTSSLAQNIVFSEQYSPNNLQLTVNSNVSGSAQTPNQLAVATVIDQSSGSATGAYATAITQLTTLNSGQLSHALNQLSGDIYPSLSTIQQQTTTAQMQLISNRLASLTGPGIPAVSSISRKSNVRFVSSQGGAASSESDPADPFEDRPRSWSTWAQGYGLGGNIGGDGNAGGTNYRLGGTLFGVERWLSEYTMIGVLGGYAGTTVGDHQDGSTAQINSYQAGLYELYRQDSLYVSNVDAFTNDSFNVSRPINLGSSQVTATGTSSGNQWAHYTEAGKTFDFDDVRLQPFVGVQYMYLDQQGYTESGAGSLDLTTSRQIVNSTRSSIGARLSRETSWGSVLITPSLSARYLHEFGNGTQLISSSLSGAPTATFATSGNHTGRDFGLFTLGATAYLSERCSLYGNVDTQVASSFFALIGSGGIQYSW